MKNPKKVTKEELKNSLLQSLEYNSEALDYVENQIVRFEDLLKYNENDEASLNTLNVLKYIEFSLNYLDKSYNETLKSIGVFRK